jgi:hypothetical protein
VIAALIAKFPDSYGREVPGEADGVDEWLNLESTKHWRTHLKKGLAALLAAVFMTGLAGVTMADEKKADDKAQTEKAADSPKMRARSAAGTVKTAAADSLVVTAKKGDLTFAVDDKTMIKKGGKAITASDIKPGDSVHVRYMEHDGKMVAQSVTVKGGGTASKNPCASKK